MIAHVFSATNVGFKGNIINVECDTSNGLPSLLIVGLGNKAIDEAKERVRSAIKNTGLEFPRKRITINLAPANLPKYGAHFDLPIAVALLIVSGQVTQAALNSTLLVGELALDGTLRAVRGVVGLAETARAQGLQNIIVPKVNALQAQLVDGITVLPADSLRDVYLHLTQQAALLPATDGTPVAQAAKQHTHLQDIKGQEQAKRALTIAAAGRHNILISGPPGAGKTMLAKALVSILPPLSRQEIIETTKLHSLASETYDEVVSVRPFRSPHHSASHVALVGGGQNPRPGEISLAHRGVLFLDELPEYSRQALESLRQPLEDKRIHISRASDRVEYPADFMLVATQNPCPCGYAGDTSRACICSAQKIINYQSKLSGPLLDRIDMFIEVSRVDPTKLLGQVSDQNDKTVRLIIQKARQRQQIRYGSPECANAHMDSKDAESKSALSTSAKQLLNAAAQSLHLSTRSYFKIIKVARTIADIETSDTITPQHISEALHYRPRSSSDKS